MRSSEGLVAGLVVLITLVFYATAAIVLGRLAWVAGDYLIFITR